MQRKLAVVTVDVLKGLEGEAVEQLESLDYVELLPEGRVAGSTLQVTGDVSPDVLVVGLDSSGDSLTKLKWVEGVKRELQDLAIFVISEESSPELLMAAMRAGVQEFLGQPLDMVHLIAALERVHLLLLDRDTHRQKEVGHVVSLHSIKGGVGVTTLCANLAVTMSRITGKRAAIVDLDLQMGDIANYLDLSPTYSILDACDGDSIDPTQLQSCMTRHDSNVFILAEPKELLDPDVIQASQVSQILHHLKATYPFVAVDTPHVLDQRTSAAISGSDHVILVTVANVSSIRATRKSLNLLRSHGFGPDKVKVLVNRVGKKDEIKLGEVQSALDYPVSWTVPNDYRDVIESINTGVPLAARKRLSSVGKSIQRLATDLQHWEVESDTRSKIKQSTVT